MWACDNARIETPPTYWQTVETHWLSQQLPDGGWAYGRGNNLARETMTTAGINSLYIVLDRLYAQTGTYKRFEGIRKSRQTQAAEARLLAAVNKGLEWMNVHMRPPAAGAPWAGYRQFGMERLGLASGLKYIGGRDWYRLGAGAAVRRIWGKSTEEDAFWLLFLVYGRAPVLFNKLQAGDHASWNYYPRDMHSLCRYLTRKYERIYKWQVVSLEASDHDLADAPILYISGTDAVHFTEEELTKLRTFCDRGGTVVGQATLASETFSKSFKEVFTSLFQSRGFRFRKLPADHPVYLASGRSPAQAVKVPLEGMSDHCRVFVFLLAQDVAGAWHRNLTSSQQDLFDVMADIRHYAAPPYDRLPTRLRPHGFVGPPAAPLGTIKVARLKYPGGHWDVDPTAWQEMGAWAQHYRGISVDETWGVSPLDATDLAEFDMVHIAGHGRWEPSEPLREALVDYARSGGLILADAVGGDPVFLQSFQAFVDQAFAEKPWPLRADHPIVKGTAPGGEPLASLRPTLWSLEELGNRPPPIATVGPPDKTAVLFCRCDLTVSMNGQYYYGLRGYETDSARRIMANILAYRLARTNNP
jgi:hypothetical protein